MKLPFSVRIIHCEGAQLAYFNDTASKEANRLIKRGDWLQDFVLIDGCLNTEFTNKRMLVDEGRYLIVRADWFSIFYEPETSLFYFYDGAFSVRESSVIVFPFKVYLENGEINIVVY